jgi:hypothetical protein
MQVLVVVAAWPDGARRPQRGRPHRFSATGPAARLLLIAVPGGIENYFREINAASAEDERTRIGEDYGIRVVPG